MKNRTTKKNFVSVVYVYFNTPQEIVASIDSVKISLRTVKHEIIIVENNSSIPLPKELKNSKNIKIISNKKNVGYGWALNRGIEYASGEYILCTNTDTVYLKNAISIMLNNLKKSKKTAVVGPKMINRNNEVLETKSRFPLFPLNIFIYSSLARFPGIRKVWSWFHYGDNPKIKYVDVIGGASMLFKKNLFWKAGGFDERFFLYFEEADICLRLKKLGYKTVYVTDAQVVHEVGKSLKDKEKIQKYFEISRFRFISKHQGILKAVVSEGVIRFFTSLNLIILSIFIFSLYLNLNRITTLLMFYGDFARDMLAARDMLITGAVPLVGIPSSVVWLHQGPLSIYFIGLSFLLLGFEPYSPAIFYGVLGSVTGVLIYFLGKELYGPKVGILSMLMFVTSPLVIVNLRIPYHTAPIPFFTTLFFIAVFYFLKYKRNIWLFCIGILLGALFLLELSNAVLILVTFLLFVICKVKVSLKKVGILSLGFGIGVLPFLLYDLTNKFYQLGGFSLWVANRTRLFLGLTLAEDGTSTYAGSALILIWQQFVRFIFPASPLFVTVLAIVGLVLFLASVKRVFKERKVNNLIILIGLFVPVLGFVIHAKPGTAYFPVLFPLLSIACALFVISISKKLKFVVALFVAICIINAFFVLQFSYFLNVNGQDGSKIEGWNYGLGVSLMEQREVVEFIQNDSKGKPVNLRAGGFLQDFATSIDNYRYLLWLGGISQISTGKTYRIYQNFSEIPLSEKIVFRSDNVAITNNE